MEKMVSACGLVCTECKAYLATKSNDDNLRLDVAEEWSLMFKADIKPETINCEGCLSKGDKRFFYCNMCNIRACVVEKGLQNCAYCDDYICDKLDAFLKIATECKTNLENIRKEIGK